jgi:signal transduction histidine kinase
MKHLIAESACRQGFHAGVGSAAATARRAHDATAPELRASLIAAESERKYIARELHDDLGQQVALLLSKLDMTAQDRRLSPARMRARLLETQNGLQQLAMAIHNLSHRLYPARLRLLGLEPTLRALCSEVSAGTGARVYFHADGFPIEVSEDTALSLFRVAQESLQNALRHGAASRIDVLLAGTHSQLTLRVVDNGKGFGAGAAQPVGMGLLTMRERVEMLGGRLAVTTAPTGGVAIEATVPLDHRPVTAARVHASDSWPRGGEHRLSTGDTRDRTIPA